jgi:TonB family protein
MFKSYPVRAFLALSLLAFVTFAARAQQPSDLNTLIAPLADAISHSGKHKVCVLPLRGPDDKYTELGLSLAKKISATLAASVPGFKVLVPPSPQVLGSVPATDVEKLAKKSGAEIVVEGSFSFGDAGIGVSLSAYKVGKKRLLDLRNGLLAYTAEIPRPVEEPMPTPSDTQTPYRAGQGGVDLPKCIRCPDPQYSEAARSKGLEGIVVLQLVVGTDGRVVHAKVIKAASADLADVAMAKVKEFRFKPAIGPNGKAVPVIVNYEITFRLSR